MVSIPPKASKARTEKRESRQKAERRGLRAETLACWLLRLKGYRILTRRFKTRQGEIDIVAQRGARLAFVEVKARQTPRAALEALTPRTQRRIENAARQWTSRAQPTADLTYCFDAILVCPWRWPCHVTNAFAPQAHW